MTNFEKIKNMTVYELAKFINDGVSSDPCDYCIHSENACNSDLCGGKDDVDIIAEWLRSEAEE